MASYFRRPEDDENQGIRNPGGIVAPVSRPAAGGSAGFMGQLKGLQAKGQDPKPVVAAPAAVPTAVPTSMPAPTAMPTTDPSTTRPNLAPQTATPVLKQAPATSAPSPQAPAPVSAPAQRAPGSSQGMANDLWQRAMQAMNSPSRYDADVVKQGASVIEDTINRMRKTGMRNLGEHHAGRGLTGSSLESTDVKDLEGELDANARAQLSALGREQAMTYGADRNSAFGFGLGTAGLGENIESRYSNDDYRNRSLSQDRYFGDRSHNRADLGLAGDFASRFGPEVVERIGGGAGGLSTGGPSYFGGAGTNPQSAGTGTRSDPTLGMFGGYDGGSTDRGGFAGMLPTMDLSGGGYEDDEQYRNRYFGEE